MNLRKSSILIIFILINLALSYFFLIHQELSISSVKEQFLSITSKKNENPIFYFVVFFVFYYVISAFAIPIAGVSSVFIGALFGFYKGLIIISFSSSLGALSCFLLSRYIFRNSIEKKFERNIILINKKIEGDGLIYLFILRMIPIFPFFLVNLLFGLTKIKAFEFYLVSQLGMFAGTCLYVNAGSKIAEIDKLKEIFNIEIIISFALIGLFPFLIKKIYRFFN